MDGIKTEILADNSETTINSLQIEILRKHFPQCFDKNGNFIAEKLNEIVADSGTAFSKESYGLNWLGKSYARLLANENPLTLLAEDKTHNQKPENKDSQNLLIKGDNLEVLKHLKGAYSESIKMIYIDPPYNTGSDGFVYQDDRKFTPEQLAELAGIETEEAKRILEFTQSKANSHSAWLTFMYPRLYIARELLREDGFIFISIDDSEGYQLKVLCDEVFGEQNFAANLIWKKKSTTSNSAGVDISAQTDYTLCYRRSEKSLLKRRVVEATTRSYPESDAVGNYRTTVIEKKDSGSYKRETMKFEIIGHKPRPGKRWQLGIEEAKRLTKLDRFFFDGEKVKLKIYDFEDSDTYSAQPNLLIDKGSSDSASRMVNQDIFGIAEVFDTPKPIELISHFIDISNCQDGDIVLDFFAGSGTTAHSIIALKNLKLNFILVQIPEVLKANNEGLKYQYRTVFDLTKARIEKAAENIRDENPDYEGDLGFKIFETLPIFEGYLDNIERLEGEQGELFDGSVLSDDQLEHLLTTWKVYDGIPLTQRLIETDLAGYTAYRHDRVLYLMHQGFKTESLKAFLSRLDETDGDDKNFDVEKVVLFGYNFDSKNQLEINEAVRQYQNRKEKTVSVVVRY